MPEFTYIAKEGPHRTVEGTLEAADLNQAVALVWKKGLTLVDIKQQKAKIVFSLPLKKNRVRPSAVVLFTRQASDLISAGVPILKMLQLMANQTRDPFFKKVIEDMAGYVRDGGALSEGMAKYPQIFSDIYVSMVRSGEFGADLKVIMQRLADWMEQEHEHKSQIKNSLIYPALILSVGIITVVVLFTFVVPKMSAMFDEMGERLPWITVSILSISRIMCTYGWIFVLMIIAGIFGIDRYRRSSVGRHKLDALVLKLPMWGSFISTANIGRVSRSMGTLLESGVPILSAMEASQGLIENTSLKNAFVQASDDVARGSTVHAALGATNIFPETMISMIAVGEESGGLAISFSKLADYCDRITQRFLKQCTVLVEPILILGLGLTVGFVFIGILLPIMRMDFMVK